MSVMSLGTVGRLVSLQSCVLASYVVISVSETKETFKGDFTLTVGFAFNTHVNPISSEFLELIYK